MPKGSKGDINYLRLKLKLYIHEEQYEKAEVMRRWIVELGGDPEIKDVVNLIKKRRK